MVLVVVVFAMASTAVIMSAMALAFVGMIVPAMILIPVTPVIFMALDLAAALSRVVTRIASVAITVAAMVIVVFMLGGLSRSSIFVRHMKPPC